MQVQQIVRASADVLTITHLAAGDVYKRIVPGGYGSETSVVRYGVVQDVMNNGEDSAVVALEYTSDYNGATAAQVVIDGSKPLAIYPATPDEVTQHVERLITDAEAALHRATEARDKAATSVERVRRLSESIGTLTAPQTVAGVIDATPAGD